MNGQQAGTVGLFAAVLSVLVFMEELKAQAHTVAPQAGAQHTRQAHIH